MPGGLQDDVTMKRVDRLMKDAITKNVFPGGVLLVSLDCNIVFFEAYGYANLFSRRPMTRETVFDLASLTKPLATTLAVMNLMQQSNLSLEQHLGSILPSVKNIDKGKIQIENLLYHNSGFPDYRPYYELLCKAEPGERKNTLKELLIKEALIHPPGHEVVYSDLGFMMLRWVIEAVSGSRLDHFVEDAVYRPMGLNDLFFVDLDENPRQRNFAATEQCPWRNILLEGMVHDDNAYAAGGIDGHAGLFGTAQDILLLLSELMSTAHGSPFLGIFDKDLVQTFFKRSAHTGRALGFDTPSLVDSSCGRFFSKNTVGHLGFTGTSFWMDLDQNIIVILLTNRIHPSRKNNRIKAFRPKIHDAIMEKL